MKFFTNKSIWAKMLIIFAIVLLLFFLIAKPVHAEESSVILDGFGKLIQPIVQFIVTIADALMNLLQSAIMGIQVSMVPVDLGSDLLEIVLKAIVAIATIVVVIISVVGLVSSGVGIPALIAGITKIVISAGVVSSIGMITVGGIAESMNVESKDVPDKAAIANYTRDLQLPTTLYLPSFSMSPEEIFQGKILLFNVDFFGDPIEIKEATAETTDENGNVQKTVKFYYYEDEENGEDLDIDGDGVKDVKGFKTSKQDLAADLGSTIKRWYVAIRNIVLVCMMIVLLYIGIRMLLSTLASDKAKYRQMLMDWFIGLFLLFFMHYIMAFGVAIVQSLTNVVSSTIDEGMYAVYIPADKNGNMADFLNEDPSAVEFRSMALNENKEKILDENGNGEITSQNLAYLLYPTNLIGQIRLQAQLANYGTESIGYSLCYLVLVLFTVIFSLTYLKRVLYMAFLTLIAPVVTLTYPIDKINDGSAQGFNKWFREYIFNLLIQPMHLLLYYILVGSAFELSSENIIYSLVAIGFMLPAEKLLRSFFGFQKSETAGSFAGVAGAAIVMSGVNKISSLGRGKSSKDKGGSGSEENSSKVREDKKFSSGNVSEDDEMFRLAGGTGSSGSGSPGAGGSGSGSPGAGGSGSGSPGAGGSGSGTPGIGGSGSGSPGAGGSGSGTPGIGGSGSGSPGAGSSGSGTPGIGTPVRGAMNTNAFTKKALKKDAKRKIKNAPARVRLANARRKAYKIAKPLSSATVSGMRGFGRVAGAVGLGAVGVAAGIATGSGQNVIQYGATGVAGGYIAGKNIGNNIEKHGEVFDNRYNRITNRYEELQEADENKRIIAKMKDAKSAFRDNGYDRKQIKELEKDGTLGYYIANNVSEKDMVTIQKMRESNSSLTAKDGVAIAKYNEKYGDGLSGSDRQKTLDAISSKFQEKRNVSEAEGNRMSKQTAKYMDQFRKIGKSVN